MDKIKLVIVIVTFIVNGTNCDTDCDCKSIMELQEFMQKEIFQNKFEISKMNSRLRRLEASKRHLSEPNNKASSQVQDLKKEDTDKHLLGTILKKTLSSEKRIRKKFVTVLKGAVENINNSVSGMRTETESLMEKYNETFVKSCEKYIEAMKEVTVNINKTINEEINIINESLHNLTEELSDANKEDGEWSSWENWGSCSVSCGGGIQSRLRSCSNPRPSLLGSYCDGSPEETRTCNKHQCSDSNGLSTPKSNTIDTLEAEVTRVRSTGVNKANIQSRLLKVIETKLSSLSLQVQDLKKHDSKEYVLETIVNKTLSSEKRSRKKFESVMKIVVKNINNSVSEIRTETENLMDKYNETFVKGCDKSIGAMKEVTVNINKTMYEEINIIAEALNDLTEKMSEANKKDGEWSSWENWGSCSVSCGGGIQSRLRTCSNPRPSLLGRYCNGTPDETTTCNKRQCSDGGWSSWQRWGSCSVSCGGGIQSRLRACSNPRPSLLGRYCDGSPDETRTCNKRQCAELNVAFTAYHLDTRSSSDKTIVFTAVYINYGNAYSTSTGKFTCKVPGLYHFSVTLTKAYSVKLNYVEAYLRINGSNKLKMWYDPYDQDDKFEYGATPLTLSGTFHLNKNDVVDIYGTHNNFAFWSISCTFTGYLITPD